VTALASSKAAPRLSAYGASAFGASAFGAISVPPDLSGPLPSVHSPLQLSDSALSVSARCLPPAGPIMDADLAVSADLVLVALDAPRSHPPPVPAPMSRDTGRAAAGRAGSFNSGKNTCGSDRKPALTRLTRSGYIFKTEIVPSIFAMFFENLWDASHDDAIQASPRNNGSPMSKMSCLKNTNWLWSVGGGLTHSNPHDDNELHNTAVKF
jgi:hypothetical protein